MIKNLAFSGGGTKCLSYIGCLKYFEENNLINELEKIIGTSGGSIFGLILVLGYKYEDTKNLAVGLKLSSLKDINVDNIFKFFNNYGIDTGNKLSKLIKVLIKKKYDNENITFLELYQKTKIEFTVTGMCVNTSKTEYFNYINSPDMKVWLAIRISCSIPIIYNYVGIKEKIYIDGGALDNYPIEYFKTNLGSTFGFFICDKESQTVKIKSLDKFMLNILVAMNRKIEKMVVEKHMKNTIKIECNLCGTDFNLDQNTKINLIESGYESTRDFFDKLIIKSVIDNMINSLH